MSAPIVRPYTIAAMSLAAFVLAGCSTASKLLDDVTGEKDTVLPGKRENVSLAPGAAADAPIADTSEPVVIPAAQTNASWAQPGGSATNALGNLALGASLSRAWSANAGKGSNSDGHIIATPIVANGTVYVLDSEANVSAFSASSGAQLWLVS